MSDPTTPAPELTALDDDALLGRFAGASQKLLDAVGTAEYRTQRDRCSAIHAEILRRLAAAERPAEGTVVIPLLVAQDAFWAMDNTREITVMQWHEDRQRFHESERQLQEAIAFAASSAPAEGDTVVIHTGEIPKGQQWIIHGRVIAKLHISTGLDAVDAAFAASSAPADAALGQGE